MLVLLFALVSGKRTIMCQLSGFYGTSLPRKGLEEINALEAVSQRPVVGWPSAPSIRY